jgi:hypothetical protein
MLKKLTASLNPFFAKRADKAVEPEAEAHPHSFSCACKGCVDETNRLTRVRLKAQGA